MTHIIERFFGQGGHGKKPLRLEIPTAIIEQTQQAEAQAIAGKIRVVGAICILLLGASFLDLEGCSNESEVAKGFQFTAEESASLPGKIRRCSESIPGNSELKQLSRNCLQGD